MLRRLLLGLVKGLAVGGAIGALLHFALQQHAITGGINYALYGAVALLAGVFAGQPPWRKGAWVASLLKGIFGFGIGAALYALVHRFLPGGLTAFAGIPAGTSFADAPLLFAPAVATVYATLVELDDGGDVPPEEKTNVRVKASDDNEAGDEVEVPRSEKAASRAKR